MTVIRPALLIGCLCLALSLTGWRAQAQESGVETAVKATYLYKFPPFIEWPAAAPSAIFTICVIGTDPLGRILDAAVAGQQVKGRPIVVRRVSAVADYAGCQLAYVTGSEAQSVPVILAALRGRPVVTVTDGARDGQSKGMLNFVVVDNRVRFEIDDRAASAAGLAISSKLLSLAVNFRAGN